jgi:hypothetical protein
MKLLIGLAAWKQWIKEEEGRFAEITHTPPKMYPCYAYMELESWGQESLRPNYLYQHDVDAMAGALLSMSQKM